MYFSWKVVVNKLILKTIHFLDIFNETRSSNASCPRRRVQTCRCSRCTSSHRTSSWLNPVSGTSCGTYGSSKDHQWDRLGQTHPAEDPSEREELWHLVALRFALRYTPCIASTVGGGVTQCYCDMASRHRASAATLFRSTRSNRWKPSRPIVLTSSSFATRKIIFPLSPQALPEAVLIPPTGHQLTVKEPSPIRVNLHDWLTQP